MEGVGASFNGGAGFGVAVEAAEDHFGLGFDLGELVFDLVRTSVGELGYM